MISSSSALIAKKNVDTQKVLDARLGTCKLKCLINSCTQIIISNFDNFKIHFELKKNTRVHRTIIVTYFDNDDLRLVVHIV